MATLRDFDKVLRLVLGETAEMLLYLSTDTGEPYSPDSGDVVELSIAESSGSSRLVHRSTADGTATVVVSSSLPALRCDGLDVDEWAGLGSGFYVAQIKVSNSTSGVVRYSSQFRVCVQESVGST